MTGIKVDAVLFCLGRCRYPCLQCPACAAANKYGPKFVQVPLDEQNTLILRNFWATETLKRVQHVTGRF